MQGPADKWISFKKDVSGLQQTLQFGHVQGLHVAAHIHDHVVVISAKRLDAGAVTKMIVHAVDLARPGVAVVVQYDRLQRCAQFGVETAERLVQRALPRAGRAGKDDQFSIRHDLQLLHWKFYTFPVVQNMDFTRSMCS